MFEITSGTVTPRDLETIPMIDLPMLNSKVEAEDTFNSNTLVRRVTIPQAVWCLRPHKTFIAITINDVLSSNQVPLVLQNALAFIQNRATRDGSKAVLTESPLLLASTPGLNFQLHTVRGQRISVEVANFAIRLAYNYMQSRGFGTTTFLIYTDAMVDTAVAVGIGQIALNP